MSNAFEHHINSLRRIVSGDLTNGLAISGGDNGRAYAASILRAFEAQSRGPILPEPEMLSQDVIDRINNDYCRDRGCFVDVRAVIGLLRDELLRPRTRKAWRVTAVSPGGMPFEYVTEPCLGREGKSTAKAVASARLLDDYTNVSVTEIEVPA